MKLSALTILLILISCTILDVNCDHDDDDDDDDDDDHHDDDHHDDDDDDYDHHGWRYSRRRHHYQRRRSYRQNRRRRFRPAPVCSTSGELLQILSKRLFCSFLKGNVTHNFYLFFDMKEVVLKVNIWTSIGTHPTFSSVTDFEGCAYFSYKKLESP